MAGWTSSRSVFRAGCHVVSFSNRGIPASSCGGLGLVDIPNLKLGRMYWSAGNYILPFSLLRRPPGVYAASGKKDHRVLLVWVGGSSRSCCVRQRRCESVAMHMGAAAGGMKKREDTRSMYLVLLMGWTMCMYAWRQGRCWRSSEATGEVVLGAGASGFNWSTSSTSRSYRISPDLVSHWVSISG